MPDTCRTLGCSLIIAAMVAGCAAPTTRQTSVTEHTVDLEAERQQDLAARDLVEKQQRLQRIERELATKATKLCPGQVGPDTGVMAMTRPKGDFGPAFERVYGIHDRLTILYVLEGSPAQAAGLAAGDVIVKVNDVDMPDAKSLEQLQGVLRSFAPMRFEIERKGVPLVVSVVPEPACWYPILITPDQGVNAFADGTRIRVTRGMVNFAASDDELALVVSHEMAHNAMRHIEAKKKNAGLGFLADLAILILSRGQVSSQAFQQMGAMAYSQEFEAEADYVGLYIMANAGMPIDEAPLFWRRMAAEYPASIRSNHAASHPSTSYRMVALENAVREIKGKIAAHQALLPNMKDGEIAIATAEAEEPEPAPAEPRAPAESAAPSAAAPAAASTIAVAATATAASTSTVASTATAAPAPAKLPTAPSEAPSPIAAPAPASRAPAPAAAASVVVEKPKPPQPVALAAPSSAKADAAVAGLPRPGTSWTYGRMDRIYHKESDRLTIVVVSVLPNGISEKVSVGPGAPRSRFVSIQPARFENAPIGGSESVVEFAPYYLLAHDASASPPPLEAAGYPFKTGEFPWIASLAGPARWEQVTVPAGTFRALHMHIDGRREHGSFSPIVISRFSVEVWYAPEVNRYVRLEHKEWLPSRLASHTVVELANYQPAP